MLLGTRGKLVDLFTLLLTGLAVAAALIWIARHQKGANVRSRPDIAPDFGKSRQVFIDAAERLADVINESLKIANESFNADTKVSRLNVAKQRLADLKSLSRDHPYIQLDKLPQVELSIADLELEVLQSGYSEIADANLRGQSLEKDGNVEAAVAAYEQLIREGVDTPFPYRRLAIIYSKRHEREEELRVLRAAVQHVPVANVTHHKWFADRLAKKA